MKILYVVGSCLQKNTSANMSHNSYIQGLIENGHEIDVIMAKNSFGKYDKSFPKFKEANYYEFNSTPMINHVRDQVKKILRKQTNSDNHENVSKTSQSINTNADKLSLFQIAKKIYNFIFIKEDLYLLERKWLKKASKFRSIKEYDLIISNSSPAAGHKLVGMIKNKLKYKKWIQIWEDPWYFDIYGNKDERVFNEEKELVSLADYVFYVSPLTLEYQKKLFSDYANKMDVIPLPFLKVNDEKTPDYVSFGYFGDYYSKTRNLKPFYEALIKTESKGFIFGDSDENFVSTDLVKVNGRVTLDELSKVQDKTSVYICLCNLKGGQIPGKIYHYSATTKPIIFILDGTNEEIEIIKTYFDRYNRYYFCNNNTEEISSLINKIKNKELELGKKAVKEFSPKMVVCSMIQKFKKL